MFFMFCYANSIDNIEALFYICVWSNFSKLVFAYNPTATSFHLSI